MSNIIGISNLQFVHVKDLNTNITRVEVGPKTVVLTANEELAAGPLPMIVIPPAHFCVIKDPLSHYVHGVKCDLKLGQYDVRLHSEPFCLYPGESLVSAEKFGCGSTDYKPAIKKQPVIKADHALCLKAILDHTDSHGIKRLAGEMWHLEGPLLYKPTPYCTIEGNVTPIILKHGHTLHLKATEGFIDKEGRERVTGEEWYVTRPGVYLPDVHEEVVGVEEKTTLTVNTGLILRAEQTLTDVHGIKRLAGAEWLLTGEDTDEYYPEVGVTIVSKVDRQVLKQGQFCVVVDPVDKKTGKNLYGKRELRLGCCSFFLHPGESLLKGVEDNYVLTQDEALVLLAEKEFIDKEESGKPIKRKCGVRWLLNGPRLYVPPIEVHVVAKREKIPLSKNEGIYVQDTQTGQVRAVMGPQSYMLKEYEELWKKELTPELETILLQGGGTGGEDIRKLAYFAQSVDPSLLKGRDKTRVITYRCPGNTAVQVSNFVDKTARVLFGPDLVILGPHEVFNVLSLSAGKPKREHALKTICLMLGPDFISDIIVVETSDHARLRLQIAFDNHFEYDKDDPESVLKLFAVKDFIGFACRLIGSKIRAAVAMVTFDEFHRHSANVIKTAIFYNHDTRTMEEKLKFDVNNLVISAIDIQSIEPVDTKMRDSLCKSIQLAIEISTNSIEASARHEAMRTEQEARGHLERQKLQNEMDSETERCHLLELQAITAAVESTGQAKAEAQAHAEKALIEGKSEIESSKLKALALEIEHTCQLETQDMLRMGELEFQRQQIKLQLHKEKALSDVEVTKFAKMVEAIGADTLQAIATAGPETKLKMLAALGLSSTLITDGNSPINMFNTADGLVGAQQ